MKEYALGGSISSVTKQSKKNGRKLLFNVIKSLRDEYRAIVGNNNGSKF
jgi:hypothetical protein